MVLHISRVANPPTNNTTTTISLEAMVLRLLFVEWLHEMAKRGVGSTGTRVPTAANIRASRYSLYAVPWFPRTQWRPNDHDMSDVCLRILWHKAKTT